METAQFILLTFGAVFAIKVLLIPTYTSTDFEVHRNWMAITWNIPLKDWYFEKTSEWTLDYPPFFAYFELALAKIANTVGLGDVLPIREDALFTKRVLHFQRISVISCDFLFATSCAFLCFKPSKIWSDLPKKILPRIQTALFMLLVANAGLILVDNIHFQYNGFLTALLLLSIFFAETGAFHKAAFCYSVLLNFKHIYLYYAPAYVFFYLHQYFALWSDLNLECILSKAITLSISIFLPFVASFGPFYHAGGVENIQQIISRLFPVSRGLTHAYWAPNFWALYNFADSILYRLFTLLKLQTRGSPTYSSGLVQEHSHTVLPCISTATTLCLVVLSLAPLGLLLLKRTRPNFSLFLTLSAFSFFYFGYHVHEKALLLVSIPMVILALSKPVFIPLTVLFTTITTFSLFPLLFTIHEIPIKYGIGATYFFLTMCCIRYAFNIQVSFILPTRSIVYIAGLVITELYGTFLHKVIFVEKLPFVPLMIISVYNAIGITGCFFWLIKLALEDEYLLLWKKKKCELIEELINSCAYSVQSIETEDEIRIVGGVDISTSKTNSQFAVVSLTLFNYPSLELLAAYEEIVVITEPYITDYLALREADPIANVINNFLAKSPELRPDVLLCDGNGRFHIRGCGVACHIGAKSGIASVGIAKNLNLSLLKSCNSDKTIIEKTNELIGFASNQEGDGFVPFDIIEPVTMNIVRMGGSKVPVFVSAGYGIELDLATDISIKCARNRICEPIRMADLRSREKVREFFD